jgi:hypothetical protein
VDGGGGSAPAIKRTNRKKIVGTSGLFLTNMKLLFLVVFAFGLTAKLSPKA